MSTPESLQPTVNNSISIEIIPAIELARFGAEVVADPIRYAVAPIDIQRAVAHSKNPVADHQTPGMVVAYAEGRCIGYIGMLPIMGEIDGRRLKVLAPTTQFVAPEYRKKPAPGCKTVADQMYEASLKTGYDQLITGFNEAGGRIYQRRPDWFTLLPSLLLIRIRLTPLQPISSAARRVHSLNALKAVNPLTKGLYRSTQLLVDQPAIPITYSLLKVPDDGNSRNYRTEQTDCLKPLELPLANEPQRTVHFPRDFSVINWMISNPWHPTGNEKNPYYHFLSPRERFEYQAYHILERASGKRAGFLVALFSTEKGYTTMRLLDIGRSENLSRASVFNLALRIALSNNTNLIECSGDFSVDISRRPLLAKLSQRIERGYYMALAANSPFTNRTSEVSLDYCDGERPYN